MAAPQRDKPTQINRIVWRVVEQIPHGCVSTYGQVADLAGLGRAARRVGSALRALPAGSPVPWHRVLRAGGRLAFPPDSDAYATQRTRLESEGVEFEHERVDLARFGYQRSLDELLWKPADPE